MSVPDYLPGIIDTHVHVFRADLPVVAGRRYAIDYDATPERLATVMDATGIGMAVLVQPSFLGTDNSYIEAAIAGAPERFLGIGVVEPAITSAGLLKLKQAGIVGIRLNCLGQPVPDFAKPLWRGLADNLAEAGMILQIQAERLQWDIIAPSLRRVAGTMLIDHFGRPDKGEGLAALLTAAGRSTRLWFKFSGFYRFAEQPGDITPLVQALLDTVGIDRVVWGSDWPWTQFETRHAYADTLAWLSEWVPDERERRRILIDNPRRLYALGT